MNTIVELHGVSVYQRDEKILEDVDLTIRKGDFFYLIGKTGSGKSSLLKLLYGDLPLKKGVGSVVGFNLLTLSENEIPYLRRRLGVVFQDFKLLSDRTVYYNLEFVLKATGWRNTNDIKTRIFQVLSKVKMEQVSGKFPHELSGGEQQRIAIARALLNDPDFIIADEPTGNLDPRTSLEIMDIFKELHLSGRTILIATHDYALIRLYPTEIFQCKEGRLFKVIDKGLM